MNAMGLIISISVFAYSGGVSATTTNVGQTYSRAQALEVAILRHAALSGRVPSTDEGIGQVQVNDKPIDADLLIDWWGEPFVYKAPSTSASRPFDLYSKGPNRHDDNGEGDDVVYWDSRDYYHSDPGRLIKLWDLLALLLLVDGPLFVLFLGARRLVRKYRDDGKQRSTAEDAIVKDLPI